MEIVRGADGKRYKVVNGTYYAAKTSDATIERLERARQTGERIRLDYGEPKTGRSWGETNDITGYVGRSTGQVKIPLLLHNKRSIGGGGILTNYILSIRSSNKRRPRFKFSNW